MVEMKKDKTKLVCIKNRSGFVFSPEDFPDKIEKYEEGEDYVAIKLEESKTLDYILDDLSEDFDVKAFGKAVKRNYFD